MGQRTAHAPPGPAVGGAAQAGCALGPTFTRLLVNDIQMHVTAVDVTVARDGARRRSTMLESGSDDGMLCRSRIPTDRKRLANAAMGAINVRAPPAAGCIRLRRSHHHTRHADMPATPLADALAAFRASGSPWLALPFFRDGGAEAVAARVDARVAAGAQVLPAPDAVFRALALTPLPAVAVVILGQDPYPTPGDANGLAFSYVGSRRLPASLKVILAEIDGPSPPRSGDLTPWARQGVLLLNTALTVEAGAAGAHLKFGWSRLADEVVAAVSDRAAPAAFLLWGAQARAREALIDAQRHAVIACGHPSPLNRARDFPGSKPFTRANAWLAARGLRAIDWRL